MQYPNEYIEVCLESQSSIFKGLSQKEKDAITEHHIISTYNKGESIFREGDKSRGLACLVTGKAKLFRTGVGGREQILKMLRPMDLTGYKSLFSDNIWSASAMALERTTICTLEKASLVRILKKSADLSFRLCRNLSDELLWSNDRIVSLTQKHVRGRIAESLVILRDTYGFENDMKTIKGLLSREDLAHLSNMTTSNAIRTLSNMATEGIIGIKGKRISILDNNMLEHISELG
jgi:CRP/FNR family transcriptional regulator, polysaccharide utilization system transcription regulator